MSVKIDIDALVDTRRFFEVMPDVASKAASMAINQVAARGGLRMAQDAIMEQIAFPRDYLQGDRLAVSSKATPSHLEAAIRARKRATSLARFADGTVGKPGVTVTVQRGHSTFLKRSWLVKLKAGTSKTEDNYNVGLAVRIKPGDKIVGKHSTHQAWLIPNQVALLYGPSVDQVFRDVADQIGEPIAQLVADEFFRQFERLS